MMMELFAAEGNTHAISYYKHLGWQPEPDVVSYQAQVNGALVPVRCIRFVKKMKAQKQHSSEHSSTFLKTEQ